MAKPTNSFKNINENIFPTKEEFKEHSTFCKEYENAYQEVNIEFNEEKIYLKPKLSLVRDFQAYKKHSINIPREEKLFDEPIEEYTGNLLKFKSFCLADNTLHLRPRATSIFNLLENNMVKKNFGDL